MDFLNSSARLDICAINNYAGNAGLGKVESEKKIKDTTNFLEVIKFQFGKKMFCILTLFRVIVA